MNIRATTLFLASVCYTVAEISTQTLTATQTVPTATAGSEYSMNTAQIIVNRGYPVELHYITTSDGYILLAHRIPYGKKSGPKKNKPVVYLQHGLLCASSDWIIGPVNNALGYILADAGYDVWLGNARGNQYSRNHTTLNPDKDSAFWDFSLDEIGQIDVPAHINYILKQTGQKTLSYAGHSQGTITFFIAMETRPELNSKINQMFALSPITTLKNMKSPLKIAAPLATTLQAALGLFGVNEFFPSNQLMALLGKAACSASSPIAIICESVLFLVAGPNIGAFDPNTAALAVAHFGGTSVKNMVHFSQKALWGTHARYDYGLIKNVIKYGQMTPPQYNPSKVLAPVMLFYGENDWLVDASNVISAIPLFKNVTKSVRISSYSHLDFLWANNMRTNIGNVILANLPIKP